MTELCIVRHGQTNWNKQFKVQGVSDIPLNETGRTQAGLVAEYFKNSKWNLIYTSPLSRAKETSEIISSSADIPEIRTEELLIEFNFGIAEGMDMQERKTIYPERGKIPGAEQLLAFRSRAEKIINTIADRHRDQRLIVVSHACFIMEVLEIFSKGKIDRSRLKLENLSMSLLTKDSEWCIPWYNRAVHQL
ncbi:MAG: histidine phosphatase family protein [Spirochaetales bacterium]|uniref:Histidine phosphatase family protein n=1 Tax=Candidatus Thalassospirochaeta sargassi TaxID=3119039 RepID=A0AAJ1MLJ2_9SPIO|nr:histidine phosphatase family protein [Spirochaetales bacterium]